MPLWLLSEIMRCPNWKLIAKGKYSVNILFVVLEKYFLVRTENTWKYLKNFTLVILIKQAQSYLNYETTFFYKLQAPLIMYGT